MEFKLGDIVLINRVGRSSDWYSKFIRLFTRSDCTHTEIIIPNIMDIDSVLTADKNVHLIPLSNHLYEEDIEIEIYRLNREIFHDDDINFILTYLYLEYSGQEYGYFQILFFIYRWFLEFFKIDVRRNINWFRNGQICSEVVYRFLRYIGKYSYELSLEIDKWNQDTIHTGDIQKIIKQFPELFIKVFSRNKE